MICLILGMALSLRLWGVSYGLPLVVHPDENRQLLDAFGMAQRLSIMPGEFSYPAFHKYMLLAANGAYFAAGRIAGVFESRDDFALKFLDGSSSVFLVARLLSVAAGMLTVVAAWRLAKRLSGQGASVAGLLFAAGMFHLIQHSQWAISDIFLALFSTLAFHYTIGSMRMAGERGAVKETVLSFLFTGLSIATKPQGAFLIAPLIIGQYYALKRADYNTTLFMRGRALGVVLLAATALSGNLFWISDFPAAYEKFSMLKQVATIGISSKEPFRTGLLTLSGWFAKEMTRQEGPLGLLLVGGVIYSAIRRKKEDILFLSYIAVYMFAVRDWAIRYLHLFVALFPVMCAFGARFLDETMAGFRVKGPVHASLALALILPSAVWSANTSVMKTRTDTRLLAKAWVEDNIPGGASIAVDWYDFAVPLWGDVPFTLLNPKARSYYEERVPERVKRSYRESVRDRKRYRVVPALYTTPGPNWPTDMPPDVIAKASGKEVYKELYSVFNFKTVEDLKRSGALYLIISSYSYTNFLLDTDPEKTEEGVFNYLFREDLLSFNKQSEVYLDDNRFGLLFYLNKRARGFYEPLLRGSPGAVLIREFRPAGNPGPVIKIYALRGPGDPGYDQKGGPRPGGGE